MGRDFHQQPQQQATRAMPDVGAGLPARAPRGLLHATTCSRNVVGSRTGAGAVGPGSRGLPAAFAWCRCLSPFLHFVSSPLYHNCSRRELKEVGHLGLGLLSTLPPTSHRRGSKRKGEYDMTALTLGDPSRMIFANSYEG